MNQRRYRVLAVARHPGHGRSLVLHAMAQHPQLELHVVYCSLRGAQPGREPDSTTPVQSDLPLAVGYDWVDVANRGSGAHTFFGLVHPGLWKRIREGKFDAVICYVGYARAPFWIAWLASKLAKTAFLFGTDAWSLESGDGKASKYWAKKKLWRLLFSQADQILVPSTATRDLMASLRIPDDRLTLAPASVDNPWWVKESGKVDRAAIRAGWGVDLSTKVILFCAKLEPSKRPMDLLRAFAHLTDQQLDDALLVFAGDGPLRAELGKQSAELGIADRVRFLGFVNQSQLPAIYTAADLMVLPSEYEPFAVVVNEAYCCGCAVAVSDQIGAGRDLVAPVNPSLIFPCGNVAALSGILSELMRNGPAFAAMGQAARNAIEDWSPRQTMEGTLGAIEKAVARAGR